MFHRVICSLRSAVIPRFDSQVEGGETLARFSRNLFQNALFQNPGTEAQFGKSCGLFFVSGSRDSLLAFGRLQSSLPPEPDECLGGRDAPPVGCVDLRRLPGGLNFPAGPMFAVLRA